MVLTRQPGPGITVTFPVNASEEYFRVSMLTALTQWQAMEAATIKASSWMRGGACPKSWRGTP
jgi:hypothetical protein